MDCYETNAGAISRLKHFLLITALTFSDSMSDDTCAIFAETAVYAFACT